MLTSMNLNNLNSDVTIFTGFFRSSQTLGGGLVRRSARADAFLPGERSRGGLQGPFTRVASSPMPLFQNQHILANHPASGTARM